MPGSYGVARHETTPRPVAPSPTSRAATTRPVRTAWRVTKWPLDGGSRRWWPGWAVAYVLCWALSWLGAADGWECLPRRPRAADGSPRALRTARTPPQAPHPITWSPHQSSGHDMPGTYAVARHETTPRPDARSPDSSSGHDTPDAYGVLRHETTPRPPYAPVVDCGHERDGDHRHPPRHVERERPGPDSGVVRRGAGLRGVQAAHPQTGSTRRWSGVTAYS